MASLNGEDRSGEIIAVQRMHGKHHYCNVCHKEVGDEQVDNFVVGNKAHELSFGRNNHSNTICLCTRCLNNFADLLWQYLEEEA